MSYEYDRLFNHMQICKQCHTAFSIYRDSDYCEIGYPLFMDWHELPFAGGTLPTTEPEPLSPKIKVNVIPSDFVVDTDQLNDLKEKQRSK